ncbi:MAG: hypothetical protein K1X54_07890 [Flavobacteriales bacterium]|nr:hypothetical protein [Flavobacteriales bacterium]
MMPHTDPIPTDNWSSFKSHEIITLTSDQLIWQSTKTKSTIFLIVSILGFIMAGLCILAMILTDNKTSKIPGCIVALVFGVVFYRLYKSPTERIVLDKKLDALYYNSIPQLAQSRSEIPDALKLSEVIEIQLLKHNQRGLSRINQDRHTRSYTMYQLNFVFAHGHRENILNHGDFSTLQSDAQKVSIFLEIPVVNGVSGDKV